MHYTTLRWVDTVPCSARRTVTQKPHTPDNLRGWHWRFKELPGGAAALCTGLGQGTRGCHPAPEGTRGQDPFRVPAPREPGGHHPHMPGLPEWHDRGSGVLRPRPGPLRGGVWRAVVPRGKVCIARNGFVVKNTELTHLGSRQRFPY